MAISVSVNAQMLSPKLAEGQGFSLFSRNSVEVESEKDELPDRGLGGDGGGDTPVGGAVLPLAVFAGVYLFVRRDDAV